VERLKHGDRVGGHAVGMDERSNKSSEGAFQTFTVLRDNLVSPIPESLPYENACVIPLGLSTAARGLFVKNHLNLQLPTTSVQQRTDVLLIWGGSTSVGCSAAGYEVTTKASPQNHSYLKKLSVSLVFDYKSPTVVQDIVKAMKAKRSVGAFTIGVGSLGSCIDVLDLCAGKKFVA